MLCSWLYTVCIPFSYPSVIRVLPPPPDAPIQSDQCCLFKEMQSTLLGAWLHTNICWWHRLYKQHGASQYPLASLKPLSQFHQLLPVEVLRRISASYCEREPEGFSDSSPIFPPQRTAVSNPWNVFEISRGATKLRFNKASPTADANGSLPVQDDDNTSLSGLSLSQIAILLFS